MKSMTQQNKRSVRFAQGFLIFVGSASLSLAAPYYVGENPTPEQAVMLQFENISTQEYLGLERGNVGGLKLGGTISIFEKLALDGNLPLYFATDNATGANDETGMGNLSIGPVWNDVLGDSTDDIRWGYWVGTKAFFPTSSDLETQLMAYGNPTTQLAAYNMPGTFSVSQ